MILCFKSSFYYGISIQTIQCLQWLCDAGCFFASKVRCYNTGVESQLIYIPHLLKMIFDRLVISYKFHIFFI